KNRYAGIALQKQEFENHLSGCFSVNDSETGSAVDDDRNSEAGSTCMARNRVREFHAQKCMVRMINGQGIKEQKVLNRTQDHFAFPTCNKPVRSRRGVIKHTKKHLTRNDGESKFERSRCGTLLKSVNQFEDHLDTHLKPREARVPETVSAGEITILSEAKTDLNSATNNPTISACLLKCMVPFTVQHKSGARFYCTINICRC
ncbi:hypothetical protein BGZ80_005126, partial [Entomortierella chlamydospora]